MSRRKLFCSVCFAAVFVSAHALAEDAGTNDRSPTLFANDSRLPPCPLSFAPSLGFTTFNGHAAYNVGGRGMWEFDERFGLGFAVYATGWGGRRGDNRALTDELRLPGGYGGLIFEYRPPAHAIVHALFDAVIGGGTVCVEESEQRCERVRSFQLVEPTANVEISVARFLRVAVGGGYRFTFAVPPDAGFSPSLNGPVVRTSIGLGWF